MHRIDTTAAFLIFLLPLAASAQQTEHRLGGHPAVIVKRLHETQGYDYASKFYPHPAWLYLEAEAPRPMMDHPAVLVMRRWQREMLEQAQSASSSQVAAAKH